VAVEVARVARGDERVRLLLLAHLPVDEVDDLRMVHVEADHLRGAPRGAARLGRARRAIEDLEEAHEAARGAAAGELLLAAADRAEVRPRAESVLDEPSLRVDEIVDAHQVVVHALDEARGALRALVRVLRLDDLRLLWATSRGRGGGAPSIQGG